MGMPIPIRPNPKRGDDMGYIPPPPPPRRLRMGLAPAGPKPERLQGSSPARRLLSNAIRDMVRRHIEESLEMVADADRQMQRPPKNIPQNGARRLPEITGVRPLTQCGCGRHLVPGMRFCDACGQPLAYTGKTERLGA